MSVIIAERNLGYLLMREMISKDHFELIKKEKFLSEISSSVELSIQKKTSVSGTIKNIQNDILLTALPRHSHGKIKQGKGSKSKKKRTLNPNTERKLLNFTYKLSDLIISTEGLKVLYAICDVCAPILNSAVDLVPFSDQRKIAKEHATKTLKSTGDVAIESIISNWDIFTYNACMVKENDLAAGLLSSLKAGLKGCKFKLSKEVRTHIIAACMQEFERRAGQKRKTRAGSDLQESVEVILEYLNVKLDPVPQLLTGVLEADHVIKGANGHSCIVSCKRTGRERVKQVSVELQELQRHRIRKIIWFFTEFDQSNARVIDLGVRGSVFYLPDTSPEYLQLSANPSTSKYVFPLSSIRQSLPKLVSGQISENNTF
tara:strand:+ start:165 stop:1283 length:1119 start_codon:yes stop_codon:yes gene_type:complete